MCGGGRAPASDNSVRRSMKEYIMRLTAEDWESMAVGTHVYNAGHGGSALH
jgi:hypothetical protein